MKNLILIVIIIVSSLLLGNGFNPNTEENSTVGNTVSPPAADNRWYYGGNIGFSFWNNYTYLGIYPLVGYKITSQFSVGGKIGYSYINYKDIDFDSHNYGGSIFTRYRIIPQMYLHGEFVYFSHDRFTGRDWVPFLLLGGGLSQNVGPNVWVFAEVLFDVIKDEKSPYKSGEPFLSFGAGVGF